MTLEIAGWSIYGIGVVIGTFICSWKDIPWSTFSDYSKDSPFGPALITLIWPVGIVFLAPWLLGKAAKNHGARKRLAEQERQKWLSAPIP